MTTREQGLEFFDRITRALVLWDQAHARGTQVYVNKDDAQYLRHDFPTMTDMHNYQKAMAALVALLNEAK